MKISGNTLVMAIQAVDCEIIRIRGLQENKTHPRDHELLLDYEKAAEELKAAYSEALKVQSNLPPYSKLVRS